MRLGPLGKAAAATGGSDFPEPRAFLCGPGRFPFPRCGRPVRLPMAKLQGERKRKGSTCREQKKNEWCGRGPGLKKHWKRMSLPDPADMRSPGPFNTGLIALATTCTRHRCEERGDNNFSRGSRTSALPTKSSGNRICRCRDSERSPGKLELSSKVRVFRRAAPLARFWARSICYSLTPYTFTIINNANTNLARYYF